MFIGTVYYGKNIIENKKIIAHSIDEAIDCMAKYTYEKYNYDYKENKIYHCLVLDTTGLEEI